MKLTHMYSRDWKNLHNVHGAATVLQLGTFSTTRHEGFLINLSNVRYMDLYIE